MRSDADPRRVPPLPPERAAQLAAEFGLKPEEHDRVLAILGRAPTLTELGVFSVMWSEHCSYKSSRVWLRELPTAAPWVIQGPGENAGVVDIGEGLAAVFKMESHNHPSFIEPYQGAATGVGGILRDVFTMGARPVANLNALRFGDPRNPRTRRIVDGVVRGIGGYGNCVGVPTVGGEVDFHPAHDGNPLVNAMTVGIARAGGGELPQVPAARFVRAVLAPHHREDAELDQVRLAPEPLEDQRVLVGLQPELRGEFGGGLGGRGHRAPG